MRAHRRTVPLALALALGLAAFFVLEGTALAHGTRAARSTAAAAACAAGGAKAVVAVVADQNRGFMKSYSTDPSFFTHRWACKAHAVFQARRVDRGIYDVRVTGTAGSVALVTPIGDAIKVGTTKLADGGIEVKLVGVDPGDHDTAVDESFTIVFF
jgi:hypothetical protein